MWYVGGTDKARQMRKLESVGLMSSHQGLPGLVYDLVESGDSLTRPRPLIKI